MHWLYAPLPGWPLSLVRGSLLVSWRDIFITGGERSARHGEVCATTIADASAKEDRLKKQTTTAGKEKSDPPK